MTGVREYAEKIDVGICDWDGRLTISAKNEGGHNGTYVDLLDLLEWVQRNMPTLIAQPTQEQWNAALDEAANRISEIAAFPKTTQDSFAVFIRGLKK